MKKYTTKEARDLLFSYWEMGLVPSNFTEEHTQYFDAVIFIIEKGYFNYDDFTVWLIH